MRKSGTEFVRSTDQGVPYRKHGSGSPVVTKSRSRAFFFQEQYFPYILFSAETTRSPILLCSGRGFSNFESSRVLQNFYRPSYFSKASQTEPQNFLGRMTLVWDYLPRDGTGATKARQPKPNAKQLLLVQDRIFMYSDVLQSCRFWHELQLYKIPAT